MLNQGAVMIFTGICGALVVMAVAYYAYWWVWLMVIQSNSGLIKPPAAYVKGYWIGHRQRSNERLLVQDFNLLFCSYLHACHVWGCLGDYGDHLLLSCLYNNWKVTVFFKASQSSNNLQIVGWSLSENQATVEVYHQMHNLTSSFVYFLRHFYSVVSQFAFVSCKFWAFWAFLRCILSILEKDGPRLSDGAGQTAVSS